MDALSTQHDPGDLARAELASLIDLQMSPLGLAAMDALALTRDQTVLDVGCGAGQTLLQLAERVGPSGRVIGVDIGPHVLDVARARTTHLPQVTVRQEDAANLSLPDACIDAIFSRFGTMFFADPVSAFAKLRRLLKPAGRNGFVCWRSLHENELDLCPVRAADLLAKVDPTPFSFEDPATVEQVLASAGSNQIKISAHDMLVSCGDADTTWQVVTRVGALGAILRNTPALLATVGPKVRNALRSRERDGEVALAAAAWIVTASAT